jgi:hypothetical protein
VAADRHNAWLGCGAQAARFAKARGIALNGSYGMERVSSMLLIERVLGSRLEPAFSKRIHELEHRGAIDLLMVPAADVARRRLRATTREGAEVAIALPRDQQLFDGAVLLIEPDRAIVVRVAARDRRCDRARLSRRQSALAGAFRRGGAARGARGTDGRLSRPPRRAGGGAARGAVHGDPSCG